MALPSSLGGGSSTALPPLEVRLKRSGCVESVHRVHAVVCDQRGRILMRAGQANYETFIRSALKPFQALPFLSSGAAAQVDCGDRGIAISCGGWSGCLAPTLNSLYCYSTGLQGVLSDFPSIHGTKIKNVKTFSISPSISRRSN